MKYDLDRFIKAQKGSYDIALNEIKNGYKYSHWMWFIFPQLKYLGNSDISNYYGLDGLDEAIEYYNNDYLRNNLINICNELLLLDNNNIEYILGYPDNLKLLSCMTLFEIVAPEEEVFKLIIDKYYNNKRDINTINLLKKERR